MLRSLKFIVMGYLCGSVLFARICAKLFNKPAILLESKDKNPGAANAFQYGGFLCGILTQTARTVEAIYFHPQE